MKKIYLFVLVALFASCMEKTISTEEVQLQNPILPGYFADPSLVQYEGKFYMYVTADPWGEDFLACWESSDFQNWEFHKLNWPTKEACTSPLSNSNKVWAPSVIKKGDNFYMYVSVGSEVWCGVSEHPLGPWKNMLDNEPLIRYDTTRYYHVIDAEAFIDDDGKAYLYWGSGWEWINGHCFAAELNEDMSSFKSEPVEITPNHYFEGPLMIKRDGTYYLSYSEGKTIDETYEVRYATGDSPLGPFREAENSPILKTNDSLSVYGPGHHTMFSYGDKNYILYHRHRLPFKKGSAYRQLCISEVEFDKANKQIRNITPFHTQSFPKLGPTDITYTKPKSVKASSEYAEYTKVRNILDSNYGTRWEAADDDENVYLLTEFETDTQINSVGIRFEYPWKTYYPKVEISSDNATWKLIADYSEKGVTGSPVIIPVKEKATYLKVSFRQTPEVKTSIWELYFH